MATFNFPAAVLGDTYEGQQFQKSRNGSPLNLTGGSVVMTMMDGNNAITYSTQNGGLAIISGSAGVFEFSKQQIVANRYGELPYEITFFLSNGDIKTYLSGIFTIERA